MEPEAILSAIREHYLSVYRKAIASYRERFNPGGPEVLFEVRREAALVYRYYRADLASGAVSPPDFTEVNLEGHLDFEPVRFDRDGLSIVLAPIAWNGVQFRIQPLLADDSRIQSWGLRWIDPDERAKADLNGLGAYVHSITVPETDSDATEFSVDFGSAPVESLLELLAVLLQSGAKAVEVHSRSMLE